jgi:hypothetical protein
VTRKLTHDEFVESLPDSVKATVKILSRYKTSAIPIKVKCTSCKAMRETAPRELKRGRGCRTCANVRSGMKRRKSPEWYVAQCKKKNVTPLSDYETRFTKLDHKCNSCTTVWSTTPDTLLSGSVGCPDCANTYNSERQLLPLTEVKRRLRDIGAENGVTFVSLPNGYTGQQSRVQMKCKTCKVEYETQVQSVTTGRGCRFCAIEGQLDRNQQFGYRYKTLRLGGVNFSQLQGYEDLAIRYIVSEKGVHVSEIVAGNNHRSEIPRVYYGHRRSRVYFPDIWIPTLNRLVEVKSTYTLGVRDANMFKSNQRKALAAQRDGYSFTLLLFSREGERIRLPKDWTTMTHAALRSRLSGIE